MAGLFGQFGRGTWRRKSSSLTGDIRPLAEMEGEDIQHWHFDPDPPTILSSGAMGVSRNLPAEKHSSSPIAEIREMAFSSDLLAIEETPDALEGWRYRLEERWLNLTGSIRKMARHEVDAGNGFNFVPVLFALGIIIYFVAPREPMLAAVAGAFLLSCVFAFRAKAKRGVYLACLASALIFGGMVSAKLQVMRAMMPVPLSQVTGNLRGIVLEVDQNQRGAPRYLVRPIEIEGVGPTQLPRAVRLSASSEHEIAAIGEEIIGLARLQPISGPAYPGGYDFAFGAWMEGLGMSGFFMGAPTATRSLEMPTLTEQVTAWFSTVRGTITERIRSGLPGEPGDIAAALITGERSGLSKETQESLRRSGLAHILAISGLHMALVTLTVIWLIRILLIMVPGLAEQYPVRKWAVMAGFVAATIYLLLSGAGVATQRAWIMISVMLTAGLLDRQAITMRSVAIAALLILVLSPASLFQPGFQMSFAAVAALVAVYRELNGRRMARNDRQLARGETAGRRIGRYFGGLAGTSLIAGLATTLIALWHFHRVAPMGLVSNLAAMPLVSLLVMPLALASMVLMPFGFEQLALNPLGMAIEGVLAISDTVNEYEMDFETGAKPLLLLVCSGLFLVIACGLRTKLRLFALVPFAGILSSLVVKPDLPDLMIAQDGRAIAVRSALLDAGSGPGSAKLSLLYPARSKFVTDIWQKAYSPQIPLNGMPEPVVCTNDRCDFLLGQRRVSLVYDPELLQQACETSDILLAPRLWWVNCRGREPGLLLKRGDFERFGVHSLWFEGDHIRLKTGWPVVEDNVGRRPWLQRVEIPYLAKPKPETVTDGEQETGTDQSQ